MKMFIQVIVCCMLVQHTMAQATFSDVLDYFKERGSAQAPMVVYSLLKTNELLINRTDTDYRRFIPRITEEIREGVDYLVGVKNGGRSGYRVRVGAKDGGRIGAQSGAGLAIAALAMASMTEMADDSLRARYLRVAEEAFGKEKIGDDYSALSAATELYKATRADSYRAAAERFAGRLSGGLGSWDRDGPAVVSLLYYYPYATAGTQAAIKIGVRRSIEYEMAVNRDEGGENVRAVSMAAAARLAVPLFADDGPFVDSLRGFALHQLNGISGRSPREASRVGQVRGVQRVQGARGDNTVYPWYLLAIAASQPLFQLATTIDAEHINDHPTLAIGAQAPDFSLPATDGNTYTLASFKEAKVLVVVFMCNHCPTSQAYEKRIINLTDEYAAEGVRVVAISPNAPSALRIDELGYSDVGDGFEDMKVRAKSAGYNFPYLYDGETEKASKQYGPISTPHIFIFDEQRRLRYNGRIDDQENPAKVPHSLDARNAIDALLVGKEPPVAVTKTFGCSIKWIEKSNWTQKAAITWAHEPVHLDTIGITGIASLVRNDSHKLRLINLWATWCVPCVQEYPQLVTLNRMYRDRGFELVSISMDDSAARGKALHFLEKQECSSPNYVYSGEDKYKLMEVIDPRWQGALPYSLLVEPGGKIVYAKQGAIDVGEVRKMIFNDPYMGRLFPENR